ncbi:MAG: hypothetical protein A2Y57_02335 [Candidatus Woykebacteria bacterium RBG_13_40_7b]|uniref:Polymerase/histidinol phosphatase N-terminal domain-containing protein n=1 Tax=Candidatus Woykebacteria bacterium RBG_13_40_7b TaxID=1802594 RepID=A0A1G1WB91_9BACT|nr:MAG: hypothetical protein A2Y57_02335 [Candidatus Woykebacteria bacterium RBG_13_40_7b]
MVKTVDLHTHTYYSDGVLSPAQLVKKAKDIGLVAIAIADHDTVSGIKEGLEEGQRLGIEVIPGIEVSCFEENHEFHLLGYFVDWQNSTFKKMLLELQERRVERAKRTINEFEKIGLKVSFEDIRALAKEVVVKPHIAQAVIKNPQNREILEKTFGRLPSVDKFIQKYLCSDAPGFVEDGGWGIEEAIKILHRFGGIVSLAHPCWDLVEEKDGSLVFEDGFLEKMVGFGLDGIEALSFRDSEENSKRCQEHFLNLGKKYDLLITGGSDYHGFDENTGRELGLEMTPLKISENWLKLMKERVRSG